MPKDKKKIKQKKRFLHNQEKDSLHLVEFSQGKPNEISFSVLDNMSASQTEKRRRFWRFRRNRGSYESFGKGVQLPGEETPGAYPSALELPQDQEASTSPISKTGSLKSGISKTRGAHSQGNMGGLTTSFGFSSESKEEIRRRKKSRSRYRAVSIVLVFLIVCALGGFGVYYLVQQHEKSLSNREMIVRCCDLIAESDQTVVAIDNFFSKPFADDTVDTAKQLQEQIPEAKAKLQEARNKAEEADTRIEQQSGEDKQAVQSVLSTIGARDALLDKAKELLDNDIAGKTSLDDIAKVDEDINKAYASLASAAEAVKNTSPETVAKSTEEMTNAQSVLQEARNLLDEIAGFYPTAQISPYSDYVNLSLEAISYGLRSNEAILIQDRQTAEHNNDLYNQSAQAASDLVKNFPDPRNQPIIDAYTAKADELKNQYDQLRNDVGANDSFLRDYLGKKTSV